MVLAAAVSIVIIGFSLSLFTWQILERQDEAGEQHLMLSARSVFDTAESVLRRTHRFDGGRDFIPRMESMFKELEAGGDVAFISVLAPHGGNILTAEERGQGDLRLPEEALRSLIMENEWSGKIMRGNRATFVYGRRVVMRASLAGTPAGHALRNDQPRPAAPDGFGPKPSDGIATPQEGTRPGEAGKTPDEAAGPHAADRGHMMGPGHGMMAGQHFIRPPVVDLPVFLVVGIDMEQHQAVYSGFKKNALFQTLYILLAAIFIWGLSMSFIARRDLAGKAAVLERFQAGLLDNLPDGLLAVNHENLIYSANPVVHEILAVPPGSLVGRSLDALPAPLRALLPLPSSLKAGRGAERRKLQFGAAHLEIICSTFQEKADDSSLLVLIRDRTKEQNLEKSLREAEKLAVAGTLAAGVAHEIRNPLSALRGFAQYFAKKLAGQKPEETYAQSMVKEADRLNQVITDLLFLSHSREPDLRPVDLEQVVGEVAGLLQLDFAAQGIETGQGFERREIIADAKSLKQILLNLFLNSLDAFAGQTGKKTLSISCRTVEKSDLGEGRGALLEIADNGPGMGADEKRQAFDPFFTTKDKGTGLGLALVHKTMLEHGGGCEIVSPSSIPEGEEKAGGTAVRLFFPDHPVRPGAPHHGPDEGGADAGNGINPGRPLPGSA